MYDEIDSKIILQGDIIEDFCFITHPVGKLSFVSNSPNIIPAPEKGIYGEPMVLGRPKKSRAIVISHSCDIQRREFVQVCPVFELSKMNDLSEEAKQKTNLDKFLESVRGQKTFYYLFLPASNFFPESYVDLTMINSAPRTILNNHTRVLTLSPSGRHLLGYKLMNLYLRPQAL